MKFLASACLGWCLERQTCLERPKSNMKTVDQDRPMFVSGLKWDFWEVDHTKFFSKLLDQGWVQVLILYRSYFIQNCGNLLTVSEWQDLDTGWHGATRSEFWGWRTQCHRWANKDALQSDSHISVPQNLAICSLMECQGSYLSAAARYRKLWF